MTDQTTVSSFSVHFWPHEGRVILVNIGAHYGDNGPCLITRLDIVGSGEFTSASSEALVIALELIAANPTGALYEHDAKGVVWRTDPKTLLRNRLNKL